MKVPGRLLGYGGAIMDKMVTADDESLLALGFGKGGAHEVGFEGQREILSKLGREPQMTPGGSVANMLRLFAQMGGNCTMLAKVGDDLEGLYFTKSLSASGVDTGNMSVSSSIPTGVCLAVITPDGERTMFTSQGASNDFDIEKDLPRSLFDEESMILLEGYSLYKPDILMEVSKNAAKAGMRVAFDLGSPELVRNNRDFLIGYLDEYVDIVFANEDECLAMGNGDWHIGKKLMGQSCSVACLKLGSKGACILKDGRDVFIAPRKAKVIDTTGAGDAWAAGFLYAQIQGWQVMASGTLASCLSAAMVENKGACLPLDKVDNVLEYVRKQYC